MAMIPPEMIFAGLGVIGSGGVAWGVAAATRGHNRERIQEIKRDLSEHKAAIYGELKAHKAEDVVVHLDVVDRLARIETKLDNVLQKREEK